MTDQNAAQPSDLSDLSALDAGTVPLDPASTAALAAVGLTYRKVDVAGEDFDRFALAMDRGFLGQRGTPEQLEGFRGAMDGRRPIGVFDDAAVESGVPVATVDTWVEEVTVDVGRVLPMWAISGVTVSPTHRRRGIARAMLEGELRSAAAAGFPIAGLTVSEATIYGRYGFGQAATATSWSVDARRAGWIGPRPTEGERPGRIDPIEREHAREDVTALHDVVRRGRPGEIRAWANLWRFTVGLGAGQEGAAKVRAVRYTDADGVRRGVLVYEIENHPDDFTKNTLAVRSLIADGPEAYAALWRFALTHDLVATVKAELLSADEPLRWLIADTRAATVTERDHHWLRVLDVAACLEARTYRVPGAVTFVVSDPVGLTDGAWTLTIDEDGAGSVTAGEAGAGAGGHEVHLGIAELSALLVGGVRATTLRAAGRVECDGDAASWLDVALAPLAQPRLSVWY
ncbi:GNAT family N-acetyltransferase [Serinibacter arcticus]|nr:GNAT family N-acetyltransferase [Serinibacter arcticus]